MFISDQPSACHLQAQYQELQQKYADLKAAKIGELQQMLDEQNEHMQRNSAAAQELALKWQHEAERQAEIVKEAGSQAVLEVQICDLIDTAWLNLARDPRSIGNMVAAILNHPMPSPILYRAFYLTHYFDRGHVSGMQELARLRLDVLNYQEQAVGAEGLAVAKDKLLADTDAQLAQQQAELADSTAQLANNAAELADKETRLAQQEAALVDKEGELSVQAERIAELEAAISALELQLAAQIPTYTGTLSGHQSGVAKHGLAANALVSLTVPRFFHACTRLCRTQTLTACRLSDWDHCGCRADPRP